jgi:DNA-binding MarR family transcriptional regulator
MPQKNRPAPVIDLDAQPGHKIRRMHQIAVAIFLEETAEHGITPVQYAALQAVGNTPGIDQRTLAATIGFDTSTIAGVIDRLEARGLMQRQVSPNDRRARLLTITREGATLLAAVAPQMLAAQQRMLAPLGEKERADFMRLLAKLLDAHGELDRKAADS